jgi:hypothetical protein
VIAVFVLAGVALFSGGNLSAGEYEDRGNRWVLVTFGLIGLPAAYLPAYTDRKGFWTLDGDAIRWLGVVLFTAGSALRIISQHGELPLGYSSEIVMPIGGARRVADHRGGGTDRTCRRLLASRKRQSTRPP